MRLQSTHPGTLRRMVAVLASFVVAAFAFVQPASAGVKNYYATATPSSVAGGATVNFTFTLFNENTQQALGSAEVTVPQGFTVTAAAPAAYATPDATNPRLVHLRNLQPLLPKAPSSSSPTSASFTITATAPCTAQASTAWAIVAHQSNDFNSDNGNAFGYDASKGVPTTSISGGGCKLAFVPIPSSNPATSYFPASAALNGATTVPVTSLPYRPTGTPVQVEVEDANGNRVDVAVSIRLCVPSTGDTTTCAAGQPNLSGNTATSSAGLASFSALQMGPAGAYTLIAVATGLTSAPPSPQFFIQDVDADCATTPANCIAADSVNTLNSKVQTNASSGFLSISVGPNGLVAPNCYDAATYAANQWTHLPSTTTIDEVGTNGTGFKTLTLDIAKNQVKQDGPNNSPQNYQVCFSSTNGDPNTPIFTDRLGNLVYPIDTTVPGAQIAGVLPECNATSSANAVTNEPCVFKRNKTGAGDVVLTVLLLPGDPAFTR